MRAYSLHNLSGDYESAEPHMREFFRLWDEAINRLSFYDRKPMEPSETFYTKLMERLFTTTSTPKTKSGIIEVLTHWRGLLERADARRVETAAEEGAATASCKM